MNLFGLLSRLISTGKLQARVMAAYDVAQIKEAGAVATHRLIPLSGE